MITSMTGFGRGTATDNGLQVRVELRSVNSRFFDLQVRAANGLQACEAAVRERLQDHLRRGKVVAQIDWDQGQADAGMPLLDEDAARHYVRELARLRAIAGLEQQPDWNTWAQLPGLFSAEAAHPDSALVERLVLVALDRALEAFASMRENEGRALERDLRDRVAAIQANLVSISGLADAQRDRIRERLQERVQALLAPGQVDPNRLTMEVMLLAERCDMTEEIVRFQSHNTQFLATLDQGGETGRRLNFLLQEMNREANTIASKTVSAEISHQAVSIKEEVEKLREQVQNLV